MRLNETEMVKLLPAWMQEDGSDKGIATGCDIISRDAYARLKLLSRWDKIDQLSDAELDEMAWELNIQWYDSTAPIAAKRAVIRSSDRVYAKLGTPTPWSRSWPTTSAPARSGVVSVRRAAASLQGAERQPEPRQQQPRPVSEAAADGQAPQLVARRDPDLPDRRNVPLFRHGRQDHTQEVHVMGSDEIHIYHAAVVHDNNRETVSIGTDAAVISD